MGDMADWQIDQMLQPGEADDGIEPILYGNAERLLQESRHTICEVETVAERAEQEGIR